MVDISIMQGSGNSEIREYILGNDKTLIYSEPRFLSLLEEHLRANCFWIIARYNNNINGLLPFLVKDGPLGPIFNSLAYYGSNGGVIQIKQDIDVKIALIHEYFNKASELKAAAATIINNPLEGDHELYNSYANHDYQDIRIGQITHFPSCNRELLNKIKSRKSDIQRALNEGVIIQKGGIKDLTFIYSTHVANMTSIGARPKEKSFFESIPVKMDSNDWSVFIAYKGNEPIAGILLFHFNKTVEYFTPVIVLNHRKTQALVLTIYEAMLDMMKRGFTSWNWGGTWLNQTGVYDFKKRWGTTEYRYYYYTRVFNPQLISCKIEFLLDKYSGFYTIPFNELVS